MKASINRRQLMAGVGAASVAGVSSRLAFAAQAAPDEDVPSEAFTYCLNTGTINRRQLTLVEQVDVTGQAGYDGIEPWTNDIQKHVEDGGSLRDLRRQIADAGLTVESAIGFAQWIVDDQERRAAGLERMKRDMALVRSLGGRRIAAPPAGATREPMDLFRVADRYRALLELGREMDVTPQLELWGPSATIHRLGELLLVAIESGHADACLLPDAYHIYKGGSDFTGLRLINGEKIHVFHMNDYPAEPPRETIRDEHRVYPGDGVAPLGDILRDLYAVGFRGALSLELFNREYWRQDALTVVRTGLEKMRTEVRLAFG